jgi:hypothetical protein
MRPFGRICIVLAQRGNYPFDLEAIAEQARITGLPKPHGKTSIAWLDGEASSG